MVIFDGQLKKRSVNLGGGFKNHRTSIIQQSIKEREKREKERVREQQRLILQRAIRKYLELNEWRKKTGKEWTAQGDLNSAVFLFTSFYGYIYKSNEERLEQIKALHSLFNEKNVSTLSTTCADRLLANIVMALISIDKTKASDQDTVVLSHLLTLSQLIHPRLKSTKCQIEPVLSNLVHHLYQETDCSLLLDTINLYSSNEPQNYITFIASSIIPSLRSFQINFISSSQQQKFHLSTDQKLQLLSNIILKTTTYTEGAILTITNLITSIHVSLMTRTEQNFEDKSLDDEKEDRGSFQRKRETITDELKDTINVLYATDFITIASKVLDPHRACLLYGSLISLRPSMKSSLIIQLIPRTFEPLLESILSSGFFHKVFNIREQAVFAVSDNFIKEMFVDDVEFLLYDLSIFLQLLQYLLITSNDFEIFNGYHFTVSKFEMISIFLKKLVFLFIWNHSKIVNLPNISPRYPQLRRLSIHILNQIYLKNSRIKVLDNNIWLLEALNFSNLIRLIQHEDRKSNADDLDSDDEDSDTMSTLNYSSELDSSSRAMLEIFRNVPFFISFDKRVEIFQALVEVDREKSTGSTASFFNPFSDFQSAKNTATIRREHILEDAYANFNKIGSSFKNPIKIEFTSEHGIEQGIDGGGITKEFLTGVVQDVIKGDFFVQNSQHELYPNPIIGIKYQHRVDSEEQLRKLNYLKFFGKIVGKCLYEKVLVEMNFASFFLMKLNSSFKNSFDDLKSMDVELHANLVKLLSLPEDELNQLSLTFSLDEKLDGNKTISIDLIPNGSITPVTVSNRLKFVHEVSNYKLNKTMNLQSNYFLTGLYEIISKEWLTMFNPYELQLLISGENNINVADLRANTVYGGYMEDDVTIKYLWEIVEEMSRADRFRFVKFVTSVPRAPLLGFKALKPNLGITRDDFDLKRLPTASTCMNLLRLPDYKDKDILREKILYAINSEAGFDLA